MELVAKISACSISPLDLEVVMRRPSAVATVSLLLALSCVSFLATTPRAAEEKTSAAAKWEYKVARVWTASGTEEEKMAAGESQLNQAGELVQIQLALEFTSAQNSRG